MKRVSFHTLGCKLNFSETSALARRFEQGGFERTDEAGADICVVNTCSVTEHSDKKCRNLIRRLVRENPGAIVAVTGCYAQLKPEAVAAIEGVDIVLGNDAKGELFERVVSGFTGCEAGEIRGCLNFPAEAISPPFLKPFSARTEEQWGSIVTRGGWEMEQKGQERARAGKFKQPLSFFSAFSSGEERTRAFLKVQDGCDYKCSYCTIPAARGASRNIPIAEVVAQARQIAAAGQREIVITGVNTGDFGRTTGESFIDLLRALDGVDGIERYRISSIEPNLLTDEIIAFTAASTKFQPHFHIPLQSGCDRILGLMRRRYTTAKFAERIAAVRAKMPDAFIGVDVIVGFPGETQEDFDATCAFIEEVKPAFLHVFPYSIRPGTPAAEMPAQIPPHVAAERVKRLTELSDRLHNEFCTRFAGKPARVLWESTARGGRMSGFTENYIKVSAPYNAEMVGKITGYDWT